MRRLKLILLVMVSACVSSMAGDPVLQLINVSPDPAMEVVKVEYGDSLLVDSLEYNEATTYLSVPAAMGTSLTFTSLSDTLQSLELSALSPNFNGVYQSILYGVLDTNNYAANPNGKSLELNATWNAVDTAGIQSGDIRVDFFHAVGDAVEMDVADLLLEYIVNNMAFGEYSSQATDIPATLRSIFFLSTDSVTQIASRSADLSTVSGNTATIFLSGFIIPNNNNNGPVLSFNLADAAGNVTTLGFVLAAFQDVLLSDINIYPNPAIDHLNIELSVDASMEVRLALIDLGGRQILETGYQLSQGQNNLQLDLPELSHGLYFIHLSNDSGQSVLPIVIR